MNARGVEFSDKLSVAVTLTIAGTEHKVPGGSVVHFDLDLTQYGFSAEVEFLVHDDKADGGGFEDKLITDFLKPDLTEASVTVERVFWQAETSDSVKSVQVAGIVVNKSVSELVFQHTTEIPILVRRYRIEIVDPARALWTRHFPIELYTSKSLEDVINAHKGDKINISYDWSVLSAVRPLIFVHLPIESGASFYDFVLWLASVNGGTLTYDHSKDTYKLSGKKDASGTPVKMFGDDIARTELMFPEVPRDQPVVLNSYAESPRTEPIEQEQAATAIRRDILMRTPISQSVDDAVTLEKSLIRIPLFEVELSFARFSIVDLVPGVLAELPKANRWSGESAMIGKTWRVRRWQLRGSAPSGPLDRDAQLDSTGYSVALTVHMEQKDDPRMMLPRFLRPGYPGHVEGKVVSEQGEDGEKTFQVYPNDDTSLDEYKVKVPLFANQEIMVPFEPRQGSGDIYFPSYRDERVLLAIGFGSAIIAKLLDWRAGAPLSMDVQGEHILMGISDTSNTSINHVYQDEKPVFNVARTNDKDTSLIQLKEGTLFMQVKENEG